MSAVSQAWIEGGPIARMLAHGSIKSQVGDMSYGRILVRSFKSKAYSKIWARHRTYLDMSISDIMDDNDRISSNNSLSASFVLLGAVKRGSIATGG